MSMQVSTQSLHLLLREPTRGLQSQLARVHQEIATGMRSDTGLQLGAGAALSISLRNQSAELEAMLGSNAALLSRFDATQTVLNGLSVAGGSLQQTLVRAGDADIAAVVASARGAGMQIGSFINSSFSGQMLFGGDGQSMVDYFSRPENAARASIIEAFEQAFGTSVGSQAASAISGDAMKSFLDDTFSDLFNPANWKANWSKSPDGASQARIGSGATVISSVSANETGVRLLMEATTMATELGVDALGTDARRAVMTKAAGLLGDALAQLTGLSARVGIAQSEIEAADDALKAQSVYLRLRLDDLESVDPAEASTRLATLSTHLQLAYEMTAKISQLSLVKFL